MKAITISQPYANWIADGRKWIENRTWETSYRGLLAIHAGKGGQYLDAAALAEYPTGCVVAVCNLVACFRLDDLPKLGSKLEAIGYTAEQIVSHSFTEGPWCWLLRDVRRYCEPIPARGKQGIWEWDEPDLVEFAA